MTTYTGQQRALLSVAEKYTNLGYKVGLSSGKELIETYEPPEMVSGWYGMMYPKPREYPNNWDSISIVLDGLVCVDLDTPHFDVLQWNPLPPTLKERSPRGWHLYYRLPASFVPIEPKVQWKKDVDILVKGTGKKVSKYAKKGKPFGGHVVCAPSTGYVRIYPDEHPKRDNLPMAPTWVIDVLNS